MSFDYSLDYKNLDLRKTPELYRVGRGEQGVLMVEPYKSEILPHWRFRTPEIAKKSANKIYDMFIQYLDGGDFVGADMARKYLQMGYTRSRRYANHKSGRKYSDKSNGKQLAVNDIKINPHFSKQNQDHQIKTKTKTVLPQEPDALTNDKAQSARIFYGYYELAKENEQYKKMKSDWKEKYG